MYEFVEDSVTVREGVASDERDFVPAVREMELVRRLVAVKESEIVEEKDFDSDEESVTVDVSKEVSVLDTERCDEKDTELVLEGIIETEAVLD